MTMTQQEQVDHERRRAVIMADEIGHQDVRHVRIDGQALHSIKYYSV